MRKNFTLGIIIILIGVIWLLSNLEVFSFSIMETFFRSLGKLWPLILIGFGLNILLKENGIARLIVWIIILVSIFLYGALGLNNGYSEYEYGYPSKQGDYSESHDYSLSKEDGIKLGQLNFNFGAGDVRLGSTDNELMQLNSNFPKLKYDYSIDKSYEKAIIDFSGNKFDFNFDNRINDLFCTLNLHNEVIWDMDLDLGAAKAELDFKDIALNQLDLGVGAADLDLYLGEKNEHSAIHIKAGASNLEIHYPKDAGLKIKLESALSSNNLTGLGLTKNEDYYISPDYDSKNVKFEFDINMGVGNLKFNAR